MFVFFSIPIVTVGASLAAMYHVMLKTLRSSPEEKAYYASADAAAGYEKSEEEMIEELKKLDM